MDKLFKLKIVTPEKVFFDDEVKSLNLKTEEGYYEFLANHTFSIINNIPCIAKYKVEGDKEAKVFVSSGIIRFNKNELIFCCDAAENEEDVDIGRAQSAKERAEKRLEKFNVDKEISIDVKRAKAALARAMTRLEVVEK